MTDASTGKVCLWPPTAAEKRKARERADRFAELKTKIEQALVTGQALRWCMSQRSQWVRLLAENGVELLSATQLRKRKIALLPDAKPLVWAYFGAPIAKHRPLYWVGRQTEAPPPAPLLEAHA